MPRRRTPIEQLRARGSDEQYRRKGEPDALPDPPVMPAWLKSNRRAVKQWKAMERYMPALSGWSVQYEAPLAVLCLLYANLESHAAGELELTFNQRDKLITSIRKLEREFRIL